jgi:hypothetical protein
MSLMQQGHISSSGCSNKSYKMENHIKPHTFMWSDNWNLSFTFLSSIVISSSPNIVKIIKIIINKMAVTICFMRLICNKSASFQDRDLSPLTGHLNRWKSVHVCVCVCLYIYTTYEKDELSALMCSNMIHLISD